MSHIKQVNLKLSTLMAHFRLHVREPVQRTWRFISGKASLKCLLSRVYCTAGTRLRPPALRYHNIPSYHIKELKTVTLSEKKVLFLSEKTNKNKLQPRRKNKHTSFSDCSFGLTSSSLQFIGTLSDDADIFWSILVNKRQVQRYVYMCLF